MMRLLTTKNEGYFGGHAALRDDSAQSGYGSEEKLLPFPSSEELGYGGDEFHPGGSGKEDSEEGEPTPEEPAEPDWQEEQTNKLQNILRSRRASMEHNVSSTRTGTINTANSQQKPEREASRDGGGLRERGSSHSRSRSGDGTPPPRRERSARQLLLRDRSGRRLTATGATTTSTRSRSAKAPARRTKSMDTSHTWDDDSLNDDESENEEEAVEPRPGRRPSGHHHHHHHHRMQRPEKSSEAAAKDRRRQMMKRKNSFKRTGSLRNLTELEDAAPNPTDDLSIDDTVQIDDDRDRKSKGRPRPSNKRDMLRKSMSDKARGPRRRPSMDHNCSKYESNSFSKIQRMKELGEKCSNARHQLQKEEAEGHEQELSLEELQVHKDPATLHASRTKAGIGSLANLQISRANGSFGNNGSFNGSRNANASASELHETNKFKANKERSSRSK